MPNQIYLIKCYYKGEKFLKLGFTKNTVKTRFKNDMPYKIKVLRVVKNIDAEIIETSIHRALKHIKYSPKRKFSGHTECYSINKYVEINKIINSCCGIKDNFKKKHLPNIYKYRQDDVVDIFGNLNYMNISTFKS
jgi:hypothetical protein